MRKQDGIFYTVWFFTLMACFIVLLGGCVSKGVLYDYNNQQLEKHSHK